MERKYITVCVLFVLFGTPVKGGQKEIWTSDDVWCKIKTYGGGVLVGASAVALVPPVLGAIGFTPAGIVAAANGGGVGAAVLGRIAVPLVSVFPLSKAIIGVTSGGIISYLVGGCSEDEIACKKKEK